MSTRVIRGACAAVLIGCTAAARAQDVQPLAARWTATTANIDTGVGEPGTGDRVRIELLRWSTDTERDQVTAAFASDPKAAGDLLRKQATLGYVWTGGSVGFAVKYALRSALPGGGDRIVLATDRRLNSGGPKEWTAAVQPRTAGEPYVVIELRLGKTGGEGKMSLAAGVGVDPAIKSIALEGYAAAPVLLRRVVAAPLR